MKKVSVAVNPSGFSAQLDTGAIEVSSLIAALSGGPQPGNAFSVFGSIDPASSATSPNLVPITNVRDTSGDVVLAAGQKSPGSTASVSFGGQPRGWRYLFVKSEDGGGAGETFFASGDTANAPTAPNGVNLPSLGAAPVVLPLTPFAGGVKVSLGENLLESDTCDVYATDNPTPVGPDGLQGSVFVGQIRGGNISAGIGGAQGAVTIYGFVNALIVRTGGTTAPGRAFAWGNADNQGGSGGGGSPTPLNKAMTASTTTNSGGPNPPNPPQTATATAIAATPVGYVEVLVNGVSVPVANGPSQVTTSACYFAPTPGTPANARTLGVGSANPVQAGDFCYWNGTVAGYDLSAATDLVDFLYNV